MFNSKFGDLTVVTNTPLDLSKQWFTVACGDNSVTLMFGPTKTLRINSVGLWSHSVLFWQGKLDSAFELLVDSLPPGSIIYRNNEVILLYLRNNNNYGCLQVSVRLHKNNEMEICNNQDNASIRQLDGLYDLYTKNDGDIHQCLNYWVGAAVNTDLNGSSYFTQNIRNQIYTEFTKAFMENIDAASKEFEDKLLLSLDVDRVGKVRHIVLEMFKEAVSLYKRFKQTD